MRVLFICMANRIRSRGAEAWFHAKFPEHEFKSCGTSKSGVEKAWADGFADAQVLTSELVSWADKLVFMEELNRKDTIKVFGYDNITSKVNEIWDLRDIFESWNDPELIKCFESWKLDDFFNK